MKYKIILCYLKWNVATFPSWNAATFWCSQGVWSFGFCTWQFFFWQNWCFTPKVLWLCWVSILSQNMVPSKTFFLALHLCLGATDLGWTSCNLLFLFVNDLRFCRGFVWQWNRRWTIMSVLIKSSVFLFNWIFLWVERTKSLFNSYQNQNCPS